MRIIFLSQLFDPEYSIKGAALMKYWVDQGHEVEVVTTFPNYPVGKVFSGYKVKLKTIENVENFKVVRVWSHISHSKSKVSRALSYCSFTFLAMLHIFFAKKPDLLYAYHPQSTTGVIGLLLKLVKGVPFVTDVQDLWPDALVATGLNNDGFFISLIDWWCKVVYRNANKVVVLSDGFRRALIDRGVDENKVHVVYNWCPEEQRIVDAISNNLHDEATESPPSIVYAGNIGTAQSLKSLIDAVGSFSKEELRLELYGDGVEKTQLESYVEEQKYSNVFFRGYVPSVRIFEILVKADILAVHLRDQDLFKITIPSKTQSSMAMGKPILMAVGGEANAIVEYSGGGVVANPECIDSIRSALFELLARKDEWKTMGENSRKYYSGNFSKDVNCTKLDAIIKEINS